LIKIDQNWSKLIKIVDSLNLFEFLWSNLRNSGAEQTSDVPSDAGALEAILSHWSCPCHQGTLYPLDNTSVVQTDAHINYCKRNSMSNPSWAVWVCTGAFKNRVRRVWEAVKRAQSNFVFLRFMAMWYHQCPVLRCQLSLWLETWSRTMWEIVIAPRILV